jgi:gliding motility-associated-like protein
MKTLSLLLLLITSIGVSAQNEANIWYFGNNAGLDFNPGDPVPLSDGLLDTFEGCASIADANGDLVLYTDGITVWNKVHGIMLNGNGLLGNPSSTQSAIIVPQPGTLDIYYIFTVDDIAGADGLRYSVVDMTLDGGLGGVTAEKNIMLVTPCSEKVTAVLHGNGQDIWVITHPWNVSDYYAYQVSSTGLDTNPVISTAGTYLGGGGAGWACGYLKASPQGDKLCSANCDMNFYELAQFDNNTGVVSNAINLNPGTVNYGVEFSPNGELVYAASWGGNVLYQWDVTSWDPATILSTQTSFSVNARALQLGPNGKIYVSRNSSSWIGVVNDPDVPGAGCNFEADGVQLSPGTTSSYGLPPFIQSYFVNANFTYEFECLGDDTQFGVLTATYDSVMWNFDDPLSGALNTSMDPDATHIFTGEGDYEVELTVWYQDVADTSTETVTIWTPTVDLGPDEDICDGDIFTVDATQPGATYLWQDSSTDPTLDVSQAGDYSVELTLNGCTNEDTISISVIELPQFTLGLDTTICEGDNFTLSVDVPNTTYEWQDGSTDPSLTANIEGIYWVAVTEGSCTAIDSINVEVTQLPVDLFDNESELCDGEILSLDVSFPNAVYTWQDNSTDPTYEITSTGTYWVTVELGTCVTQDTVAATFQPVPQVDLGPDVTICLGDEIILDATVDGATYSWQNNSQTATLTVDDAGVYNVEVTLGICDNTDEIIVDMNPLVPVDLGPDVELCDGEFVTLDATTPFASYDWQDNSGLSSFNVNEPGMYVVVVSNGDCSFTDSAMVNYNPLPVIYLPTDTILCPGDEISVVHDFESNQIQWSDLNIGETTNIFTTGTYDVVVVHPTTGCESEASVDIGVVPPLPNDLLKTEAMDCYKEEVYVAMDSLYGQPYEILWDLSTLDQTMIVSEEGEYHVMIENMCEMIMNPIHVPMIPNCNCYVYVPNAFTPDYDGINDALSVESNCGFEHFELTIFNRWGEIIFLSDEPGMPWLGGADSGDYLVPDGVYAWVLEYKFPHDIEINKESGTITMFR